MTTETTTPTGPRFMTPFGFVRQPTAEECKLVGRTISYSEPYETDNWRRDWGDYVIQTSTDDPTAVAALAEACHQFALGDDVYIIPAGIYVEE